LIPISSRRRSGASKHSNRRRQELGASRGARAGRLHEIQTATTILETVEAIEYVALRAGSSAARRTSPIDLAAEGKIRALAVPDDRPPQQIPATVRWNNVQALPSSLARSA
jgi:hypothetical protein